MSQALLPRSPGREQTLTRYRAAGMSRFITLCFIVLLDVMTISQIKGLAILQAPFSHVTLLRECHPEIPVAPGEQPRLLDTSLDEVYRPCSHSRAIPSFPSQLEWKIGLPWANKRGMLNSRSNSRIPPQLEKNHVVPPSSQDEALSRYSVSGEVPR